MIGKDDIHTRLESLGKDPFRLAMVYGVIFPLAPSQKRLSQWLDELTFPGGARYNPTRIRDHLAQLVEAGVLEAPDKSAGYRAVAPYSAALIRHAQQQGVLQPLLRRLSRDEFVLDWLQTQRAAAMFLRCAVLSDDWQWLKRPRGRIDWTVLLDPELVDGIARLPREWRHEAIYRCTVQILARLQPAETFLAICEALPQPEPTTVANLALLRIMRGDFAAVERWLTALPADHAVVATSVRALLHTLRGEDAEAQTAIGRALELERGHSRKRILFPSFSIFTLALLSLIRLNTRESNALFDLLLLNARKLGAENLALHAVETAGTLRKPPKRKITVTARDSSDVQQVFLGFILCWSESVGLKQNRDFLQSLAPLAARARANGFLWIAAELEQTLASAGFGAPETDLHRQLGTVSLVSAIPQVEVWEHGLNALEQLAATIRGHRQRPAQARTVTRRLAWVVVDTGYAEPLVEPREQSLQKKGWSKGKPISLRKLKEDAAALTWLSDQDRTVAESITSAGYRWGGHREYYLPPKGLFLLAGHPAVLDEAFRSLEVVAVEPELVINDVSNGKGSDAISAELAPYPNDSAAYQVEYEEGDRQVTVLHLNDSVRKLCEIIPPEGLTLPGSARARLLEVVSDLAAKVRVHGGLSGTTANARAVAADSQPWVQLTPVNDGLAVRLLVQPLPGSAIQFDPGSGGELVLAHVQDEALQTRRELAAERAAATALANRCPVLTTAGLSQWRCEIVDPEDALELLDQLRQADARCLWPEGETLKLITQPANAAMKLVVKSGREWFSASGELQIDEARTLGLMQLMALLAERPRSRFVPLGDGQFIALSDSFRQQLGLLKGLSHGAGKSLRLHPLAAPALEELLDDIEIEADAAWQQQVERMREARAFVPTIPDTLLAELRPYQREGIAWLARLAHWGVGACLADDMGLGKTLQTLGLLLIRAPAGPALVVVPTSLVDNWQAEARRFAPTLNLHVYAGAASERKQLLAALEAFDVVICTYGVLQNDIEHFAARSFHTLVLDEAQAIRNAATKRAQAVRTLPADFRMAITGTPVQNNLMDLHALFGFLNPGLLGSASQFRVAHALPIERDRDPAARARLTRLIAPFVLRRTKTDVLDDLPSRTEIVRSVTLGPDEAVFYEALRRQAVADLEGLTDANEGSRRIQVLAHLTRLRLACCHPGLVQDTGIHESAKLTEFMTLLDELLQNRHKVLVFSQFVKHLKLIEQRLVRAGITYQYLDGQTPRAARTERIQAFQAGQGDVFLISLKAGGTGLNLTAADYVIHMDPWWNPAAEDQASDRAHRIGQTRPVTIYRLVAKGTIEEQIVGLHHRKRDLAEQLLQDADQVGKLDAQEMLELLREPLLAAEG
jgi:superfamily II DNA or RNA helicase